MILSENKQTKENEKQKQNQPQCRLQSRNLATQLANKGLGKGSLHLPTAHPSAVVCLTVLQFCSEFSVVVVTVIGKQYV